MAIQLNPAPVDVPYPYYPTGYTHLMIRGMVMNACGFVDRLSVTSPGWPYAVIGNRTLGDLRSDIITRLGIGTPPSVKTDTLANIQADLFNMLGMAAMVANPPPGIASMITSFINEAQQMIFNAIEMDQGANSHPPTLVNGTDVTVFDRTAVTTLALGLGKAHYGQEDAQIYMQESAKYLKDFADRQPVNIKNIVNAAIVDAQRNILAQYVTMANPATVLAGGVAGAMNVKPMVADTDYTSIAAQPVFLLALANLKAYYKQPDAQMAMDEFKLYMADMPPNTWNLVGQMVTMAQEKLYRQYNVFRNERWWTWTLNQGQTFYGIANDDDAVIPTPTGVTATIGATSTAPALLYQSTGHTCTVLQNGKVLIAGGYVNGAASPIAQLYDPSTGITSQLPNMAVGRFNHAAVLLSNGNVLLCGSQGPKDADSLASAEIFNTSTNTFGLVGSMAHGRFAHTATLLSNGDVLVSGGATITSSGTPEIYQSCEIFSNSLMQFTSTGSMATARFAHTADVLPDGTVMVIGGHDTTTTYTLTCEIYSSSTGAFTAGASLATARAFHSTVVTQESLYVIGGETTALAAVATIEQYSSVARAFSTTATLVTARSRAACRLADSNKIVITGDTRLRLRRRRQRKY